MNEHWITLRALSLEDESAGGMSALACQRQARLEMLGYERSRRDPPLLRRRPGPGEPGETRGAYIVRRMYEMASLDDGLALKAAREMALAETRESVGSTP